MRPPRLRDVNGVAALDLDDGCTGALRHRALRVGRNHPVLRGHEIPAWLRFPRRLADGAVERFETPRDLRVRHECRRVSADIRRERRSKLRPVKEQITVLRRQDRRHRRTRRRVLDQCRKESERQSGLGIRIECCATCAIAKGDWYTSPYATPGVTIILASPPGWPRSSKACATPLRPTVPLSRGATSIRASAMSPSVSANSAGE